MGFWRRIVELVSGRRLDREAAEELAAHFEMLVEKKVAAGLDEREGRRQARIEVGSPGLAREEVARGRTGFVIEQAAREVGYAARVLRRSPGLTALSVTTMGVGIGASAVLFALVSAIVLRPLPYPDADRLVRIFDTNRQAGVDRSGVARGNLIDWREGAPAIEAIAGFYAMGRTFSTEVGVEVLITAQVTAEFFSLMNVQPALGRTFTDAEWRAARFSNAAAPIGPDPVVILSHAIWRQHFGGAQDAVGRTITLERRPFKVVGVMPDGFAMPDAGVALWIPWDLPADAPRDQHYLGAVARLKPGSGLEEAEAQVNRVAADLARAHPETNAGWGVRLSPLRTETVGDIGTMLWVLFGAVGLGLFVACANVALLSLMRSLDRTDETTVRMALGASFMRLLSASLLESALLAVMGGALGVAIAAAGVRALPALTAALPRLDEVVIDGRVLWFIVAVTAAAAVLSGLPHAWRRTRAAPAAGVVLGSRGATDSGRRHRLRDAIVVSQVATALVLLAGSALLTRSVLELRGTDSGYEPTGVLVAPVFLDSQTYRSGDESRAYYTRLFARLAAIPGVTAVGGATTVPTSPLGPDFERPVWPDGAAEGSSLRMPASVRMVTPGYFPALGVRVADGRAFDDSDTPDGARVIMVNETLALRLWPGRRAVGQRLVVDYSTAGTYPYDVVGVVGDTRFKGPRSDPQPEIFFPHAQRPYLILNVLVRSERDPRALMPVVRDALREVDSQKPAQGLYALEDLLGSTYARDRQAMVTLAVFAGTAIFLAVLGVYGALSQRVRERAREIGIRVAMGADTRRLVGWVAWAGLRLVGLGVVAGLVTSWLLAGTIEGLLFGVAATDAWAIAGSVLLVAIVGLVATLVPSWRATRIDPVVVLRRG